MQPHKYGRIFMYVQCYSIKVLPGADEQALRQALENIAKIVKEVSVDGLIEVESLLDPNKQYIMTLLRWENAHAAVSNTNRLTQTPNFQGVLDLIDASDMEIQLCEVVAKQSR